MLGFGIGIGIRVGIGPIDLGLDEVEGEQFEDAIESRLDDFGVARYRGGLRRFWGLR